MIRRLPILLIASILAGCSKQPASVETFSEPVYSQQYRQGSATVIVSLSETNIPTAGKIRMLLDVHAPLDADVILPDLGTLIEPFQVADGYAEPIQRLPNGKQLHRRAWVLTPGLAGETIFQPLEIYAGADRIKTAPMSIGVESLLPAGIDTFEIKDIAAPIEILPEQEKKRRSIYTALGVLLALGLIPFLIRLTKRTKEESLIPAHESAFQSLEKLPEDPVEKIHELNRILRAYYQARFNIPMVGKTVVEMLPILEDDEMIRFLESCEEIRFSNKVPTGFADQSEQFVRGFIERTMEVPPCD